MKIYTIYAKETDPNLLENAIFIKEGFSWLAAILHFFWALYHKMWWVSFILLAIGVSLTLLEINGYIALDIIQAIRFGLLLFIGSNFNDWHRYTLKKKGYIFYGVVSAKNEDEASYKFLTNMLQRNTFVSSQGLPNLL